MRLCAYAPFIPTLIIYTVRLTTLCLTSFFTLIPYGGNSVSGIYSDARQSVYEPPWIATSNVAPNSENSCMRWKPLSPPKGARLWSRLMASEEPWGGGLRIRITRATRGVRQGMQAQMTPRLASTPVQIALSTARAGGVWLV